jgi:hypothetical protein
MLLNKTLGGLIVVSQYGATVLAGPARVTLSKSVVARQFFPFLFNVPHFRVHSCAFRHHLSPIVAFQLNTPECAREADIKAEMMEPSSVFPVDPA